MSYTLELSDEQYDTLQKAAQVRGDTPERLLADILSALAQAQGAVYYSENEMFAALDAFARIADASSREDADADE
jgi:hypothetical protein